MNIDPRWGDAGRADADRYGITYEQVIDVVYSLASVQIQVGDGPARIMYLGGPVGAAIVVAVDREARTLTCTGSPRSGQRLTARTVLGKRGSRE